MYQSMQVDVEWYLTNQILPPVSRLCEPIEGTSPAQLATQLGIDASRSVIPRIRLFVFHSRRCSAFIVNAFYEKSFLSILLYTNSSL